MQDEIKEIEEWLRDISTPTGLSYSGDRTLSNSMVDHIIDYITNLQEENKKLEEDNYELQKYINEEEGFVKDENRELGLRIDKAIEYCDREIGNIIANFDYLDTKDLQNVKNILEEGE